MKNLYSLFTDYKWNSLWISIRNATDGESATYRAILLAGWWQEFKQSENERKFEWKYSNNLIEVFAYAYISLCIGEKNIYFQSKEHLHRLKNSERLHNWLEIEWLGRSRNFKSQAGLFKKNAQTYPNEIWPYAACIQSLNQENINSKYLNEISNNDLIIKNEVLAVKNDLLLLLSRKDKCVNNFLNVNYKTSESIHLGWYFHDSGECINAAQCWDLTAKNGLHDYASINQWLAISISHPSTEASTIARAFHILSIIPNNLSIEAAISTIVLIRFWIEGKNIEAYNLISKYSFFKDLTEESNKSLRIFFVYILLLFINWQNNKKIYDEIEGEDLFVIGESHSLSLARLSFNMMETRVIARSKFIMGIKIWHLTSPNKTIQKNSFIARLNDLPKFSKVLICIGEIDSRVDDGIWKQYCKNKNNDIESLINLTVSGYINLLVKFKEIKFLNLCIQGIPAPTFVAMKKLKDSHADYLNFILKFNEILKKIALENNIRFLDVYKATVNSEGSSNLKYHIDAYHISPQFYKYEANKYLI